ncbi:MAG TPA: DUF2089 domain-containing protein [Thermomicrobiales bacterium]|jgi:hypothetical protein
MAFPQVIGICPVCAGELTVTRLQCPSCQTALEGRFRLGRYAGLTSEQLTFLDIFLKHRGIIKDVEAELGLSYRTVVGRLDDLLRALGFPTGDEAGPRPGRVEAQSRSERRRILEELRDARVSVAEASSRLAAIDDSG